MYSSLDGVIESVTIDGERTSMQLKFPDVSNISSVRYQMPGKPEIHDQDSIEFTDLMLKKSPEGNVIIGHVDYKSVRIYRSKRILGIRYNTTILKATGKSLEIQNVK